MPAAAVNRLPFLTDAHVVSSIVRIGMAYSAGADALRNPTVHPVELRPVFHVVIRDVVNRARLSLTLVRIVRNKALL